MTLRNRNPAPTVARAAFAAAAVASSALAQPAPDHRAAALVFGDSSGDYFGESVRGAGDVNNDGVPDFIVGAPNDDHTPGSQCGSARVISGATLMPLYTWYGDSANDELGTSVSGAGDVNNDGFDDLIVGAPYDDDNGSFCGSARVFSGADGSILYTWHGGAAGDRFGSAVSGAGDVNNDGFDDALVGAPTDDDHGSDSGSAFVFSGADGSILATWHGSGAGARLGGAVSEAGDVNNDGFDDVIVGASSDAQNGVPSGAVYVFSGSRGGVLHEWRGGAEGDRFGESVRAAGDVNADGFPDVIVGAGGVNAGGEGTGRITVFSGLDGAVLHEIDGAADDGDLGSAVSAAGDVNGDGFDDFMATANSFALTECGAVRVLSGATGDLLFQFHCRGGGNFGQSICVIGDLNGDGRPEIVVGAPRNGDFGSYKGNATVFFTLAYPAQLRPLPGDANADTVVDFNDIVAVLSNWLSVCP